VFNPHGVSMITKTPVIMDFYADWCAPCKRVSPTLARLAREFKGEIRLVRVNVDNSSLMVERHEVYSIPTVVFVVDGHETDRLIGAKNEQQYRAAIIKILKRKRRGHKRTNKRSSS